VEAGTAREERLVVEVIVMDGRIHEPHGALATPVIVGRVEDTRPALDIA